MDKRRFQISNEERPLLKKEQYQENKENKSEKKNKQKRDEYHEKKSKKQKLGEEHIDNSLVSKYLDITIFI